MTQLTLADRVQETSTTTGTGTYTLLGAVTKFHPFYPTISSGIQTAYAVQDSASNDWEVVLGTVTSGFLSRDTLLSSSTGSFINWGNGTRTIWCDLPAAMANTMVIANTNTQTGKIDLLQSSGTGIGNTWHFADHATMGISPAEISKIINRGTGALTSIAAAVATGTNPPGVAVDPTGKFVYITNYGSNTVSMFSINQTTGALTSIAAAVATGTGPYGVAVDPTGKFVYITNYNNTVSMFSINQTTGALTSIAAAVATGTNPYGVAVDPTGKFVYVANHDSNTVSMFSINQTTGALTSIAAAVATGTYPFGVAVDPTGKFVYVANTSSNTVSMFSINNFSAGAGNFAGNLTVQGAIGIGTQLPTAGTSLDVAVGVAKISGYAVANLNSLYPPGIAGRFAYVTDALAPVFLTVVTGGGAVVTPVFDNGVAWVAY